MGKSSRDGGKSDSLCHRGRKQPVRVVVYFPNCAFFFVYENIVDAFWKTHPARICGMNLSSCHYKSID